MTKKNTTLISKKAFIAFGKTLMCLSISLVTVDSVAQIIYHDIPDGIPTGIDFNADGTNEFSLSELSEGMYVFYADAGSSNNIHALGNNNSGWDVPNCVANGFSIGASGNWIGLGDCSVNAWGGGNPSITLNTDEFLAVRFNFVGNNNVYYGWIRFSLNNNGVITYKDYAYNSAANQSILAGQLPTAGFDSELSSRLITVSPNPVSDIVSIDNFSWNENCAYEVTNQEGKVVLQGKMIYPSLNLSFLEQGIYFLRFIADDSMVQVVRIIKK